MTKINKKYEKVAKLGKFVKLGEFVANVLHREKKSNNIIASKQSNKGIKLMGILLKLKSFFKQFSEFLI